VEEAMICSSCGGMRHPIRPQAWSAKSRIRPVCQCRSLKTVATLKVQAVKVGGKVIGYQIQQPKNLPVRILMEPA
jgi:hypothetical protein